MTTLVDLLKTIADDKSLVVFNTIANGGSDFCITVLELTRKQYYSRLSALLTGVVKKVRGKYSLTTCGVILYHAEELISKAVNQYSQLKAIDAITESGNDDFPHEQFAFFPEYNNCR